MFSTGLPKAHDMFAVIFKERRTPEGQGQAAFVSSPAVPSEAEAGLGVASCPVGRSLAAAS